MSARDELLRGSIEILHGVSDPIGECVLALLFRELDEDEPDLDVLYDRMNQTVDWAKHYAIPLGKREGT